MRKLSSKSRALILVALVVATIGAVVYFIVAPGDGEKFTEFYLLGTDGKAAGYPRELKVGEAGNVMVGIVNHEQATTSYRIEVITGGLKDSEVGPVILKNEAKWETIVAFRPSEAGEKQKVEFWLYRDGGSEPYLKPLYLWINVKGT